MGHVCVQIGEYIAIHAVKDRGTSMWRDVFGEIWMEGCVRRDMDVGIHLDMDVGICLHSSIYKCPCLQ
jgi:hypothetical protein